MLKIKPGCENCDRDLPNGDPSAMVCSYECTFCVDCVEGVLDGICPNCGGTFMPRPVRVEHDWREGVSAAHQPPVSARTHKLVDREAHRVFAARVKASSNKRQ